MNLEERIRGLNNFLVAICGLPAIFNSEPFQHFIAKENDYYYLGGAGEVLTVRQGPC